MTYKDITHLSEDDRINQIGNWVINNKSYRTAFAVDVDNEYSKAFDKGDRYIKKLLAKFPEIELKERLPGKTVRLTGNRFKYKFLQKDGTRLEIVGHETDFLLNEGYFWACSVCAEIGD